MTELPFGPPEDPAYERFLSGLNDVVKHQKELRWHGHDQRWDSYEPSDWIFEDADLADTPSGPAVFMNWKILPVKPDVRGKDVPDLFARLKVGYDAIKAKYPRIGNPVWSPWEGGDWRNAIRRGPAAPVPPPNDLPEVALKRIARVRAFEARDDIQPDEAQKIINEIVREYT